MDRRIKRSLILIASTIATIGLVSAFAVTAVSLSANTNNQQNAQDNATEAVDVSRAPEIDINFTADTLANISTFSPILINSSHVFLANNDPRLVYRITSVLPDPNAHGVLAEVEISAALGVTTLGTEITKAYTKRVLESDKLATSAQLQNNNRLAVAVGNIISVVKNLEDSNYLTFSHYEALIDQDNANLNKYFAPQEAYPSLLEKETDNNGNLLYEPTINKALLTGINATIANLNFRFIEYRGVDDKNGNIRAVFQATDNNQPTTFILEFELNLKVATRAFAFSKIILDNRFNSTRQDNLFPNLRVAPGGTIAPQNILPSFVRTQDVLLSTPPNATTVSEDEQKALRNTYDGLNHNSANINQIADNEAINNLLNAPVSFEVGYVGVALRDRILNLINNEEVTDKNFDSRVWTPELRDRGVLLRLASALNVPDTIVINSFKDLEPFLTENSFFKEGQGLGPNNGFLLVQLKVTIGSYSTIFFKNFTNLSTEQKIVNAINANQPFFRVQPSKESELAGELASSFGDGNSDTSLDVNRIKDFFVFPNQDAGQLITQNWPHLRYKIASANLIPDSDPNSSAKTGMIDAEIEVFINEDELIKGTQPLHRIQMRLQGFGTQANIELKKLSELITYYQRNGLVHYIRLDGSLPQSAVPVSSVQESDIVIDDFPPQLPQDLLEFRPALLKPTLVRISKDRPEDIRLGRVLVTLSFNLQGRPSSEAIITTFTISGFQTLLSSLVTNLSDADKSFLDSDLVLAPDRNNIRETLAPANIAESDFSISNDFKTRLTAINPNIDVQILRIADRNFRNGSLDVEVRLAYKPGTTGDLSIVPITKTIKLFGFLTRDQQLLNESTIVFRSTNKERKAQDVINTNDYNSLIASFTRDGDSNLNTNSVFLVLTNQAQANNELGTLTFNYRIRYNGLLSQNERQAVVRQFRTNAEDALDQVEVTFKDPGTLADNVNLLPGSVNSDFITKQLVESVVLNGQTLNPNTNQSNPSLNTYTLHISPVLQANNELGTLDITYQVENNNLLSREFSFTFRNFHTNEFFVLQAVPTPIIVLKATSTNKDPLNITSADVDFNGISQGNRELFDFALVDQNSPLITDPKAQMPRASVDNDGKPILTISLVISSKKTSARLFREVIIRGFQTQKEINQQLAENALSAITLIFGNIANSNRVPDGIEWYNRIGPNKLPPTFSAFQNFTEAERLDIMAFNKLAGVTYNLEIVGTNIADQSYQASFMITVGTGQDKITLTSLVYQLDNFA